jgi:NADH dehydrogenase [ubiquinone] 1 alpha subcomplex assembly factor 1
MLITLLLLLMQTVHPALIYNFQKDAFTSGWRVVDDSVMGGLSQGKLTTNDAGHGVYYGTVSIENNGGFSSLRYRFDQTSVFDFTTIVLRIKGDGKRYQFRVRDKKEQSHSYITYFKTTGEWQDIEIKLADMFPSFRGRKLTIPNFNHNQIEELAFLIGNKRSESFELMIDKIEMK